MQRMTRIGQTIRDKRVLKLIGGYLRSGVMINGVVIETEEGTPQGGLVELLPASRSLPRSPSTVAQQR